MKNLILTILFISSFYLSLCQGVLVKQTQKFLLVNPGESVTMDCYQDDANYFNMYWYQQKPGEGLKLMIYSVASGENQNMEPDFQSGWKLERKDIHNSVLNLSSARIDDSAVYYCAASWGSGYAVTFGEGTLVSILEQGKKLIVPKVTIFNPNPKELKDHEHASFVCVASGFYPEHVSITWKVNGEKRQTYDQNKATENNDKTYSISRRLSVTKDEYFTPSNTFQCEASFPDKEIGTDSKVVNGKPACSKAKKDQYRIEVNNGKLSYIMVLCKSALYAIVVAAIMLRKKMKSSTY